MPQRPLVVVSACLLGEPVRYDGRRKQHPFVADELPRHAELWPLCPEHGCGMPVPREPVDLHGEPRQPRMVTVTTGIDHTVALLAWCALRGAELRARGVVAAILKARSPSCGVGSTPIYPDDGGAVVPGSGLFTLHLAKHLPSLRIVEDEALNTAAAQAEFVAWLLAQRC